MEQLYFIYDLKKDYPGFVGGSSFAVISDLAEDELYRRCPELKDQAPLVYFTRTAWRKYRRAHHSYQKNEEKFEKRQRQYEDLFGYEDEKSETHSYEMDFGDIEEKAAVSVSVTSTLLSARE